MGERLTENQVTAVRFRPSVPPPLCDNLDAKNLQGEDPSTPCYWGARRVAGVAGSHAPPGPSPGLSTRSSCSVC